MSINKKRLVYGLILGFSLVYTMNHLFNYAIKESDLIEITGTLDNEIEVSHTKNGAIALDFKEDNFRYNTVGIGVDAFNDADAKKYLHKGSIVKILVDNSGAWEDGLNRNLNLIRFYSLKSDEKYYMTLDGYNEGRKGNRWSILLIWFIFFGLYIYEWWIKEHE